MFRKFLPFVTLVVALLALAHSPVMAGSGGNQYRVRANVNGPTLTSGKADYRERLRNGQLEQRFSVEVEDAAPGDVYAVAVNGTIVGMIVIDDLGFGEINYRTPAFNDDPDVDPIPDNFPHLVAGDIITVGNLAGTFR